MSIPFMSNVDLNKNYIENFGIQVLATAPGTPVQGQIYFDSALIQLRIWNGTAWQVASFTDIIETIQDAVGGMVTGNTETGINVTYDDALGLLNFAVTDSPLLGGQNSAFHLARANHTGTQLAATISDFNEAAQDAIGVMVTTGNTETGITVTYDDINNVINFAVTDSPLLGGQNLAYVLSRANHTGTQAPATITFAATDRLLGRDTAAGGPGEEITVGGGIEFTGTGGIQTSALTGDVTKTAGGTATTIAADAVTNAKAANMAVNTIKGRVTAGTGDPEDLTAAQTKTILAITAADVSGFDTQVRTNRLDQMAAPTASVNFNSQKITALLDPTLPQDAATKSYVDAVASGMDVKASVRVSTTAALQANTRTGNVLTASAIGVMSAVDGVTLVLNDRILVKDEATTANNGIYTVTTVGTAGVAWVLTRSTDADTTAEVNSGMFTFVEEGTTNQNSGWMLTTDNPITLNTTGLVFAQFSGAGAITAGNGLTKTGSTLDIGQGTGITVSADDIAINTAVVVRKFAANVGDGVATAYVITHNLATLDVTVEVFRNSGSFERIFCDVEHTTTNTTTVRFSVAPAANAFRCVIHG